MLSIMSLQRCYLLQLPITEWVILLETCSVSIPARTSGCMVSIILSHRKEENRGRSINNDT